jgi:Sec-independent protein translocase protein TatA
MEFLGIGPLELFFIIIIALIILGPKDMVKAGRTLGKYARQIITSENWRMIQQATQEMRNLPNRFIRDAGLEDIEKDLSQAAGNLTKGISQTANELSKGVKVAASVQSDLGLSTNSQPSTPNNPDLSDWITPSDQNSEPTFSDANNNDLSDWITPPSSTYQPEATEEIRDKKTPAQPSPPIENN